MNDDYAHFCIKCGRVLKEEYSRELQPIRQETVKEEQPPKRKKGLFKHRTRPVTGSPPRNWNPAVVLPLTMMLIVAFIFAAFGYFCNMIIYIALGTVAAGLGYLYSKDKWTPEIAAMLGLMFIMLLFASARLW